MSHKILFYIRRTHQYFSTRTIESKSNDVISDHTIENVKRCESFWPAVTGKPYIQIRAEMAEISYAHNISCKPDIIYNYSIDTIPVDHNIWVLPIDEDDLIDPRSLQLVRDYDGERNIIIWKTVIVGHQCVYYSQPDRVLSNAYALRSNVAARNSVLVHKHKQVRLQKFKFSYVIDTPAGLKIETPASAGKLWEIDTVETLRDRIERFKELSVEDKAPHLAEPFARIQSVFTLK